MNGGSSSGTTADGSRQQQPKSGKNSRSWRYFESKKVKCVAPGHKARDRAFIARPDGGAQQQQQKSAAAAATARQGNEISTARRSNALLTCRLVVF